MKQLNCAPLILIVSSVFYIKIVYHIMVCNMCARHGIIVYFKQYYISPLSPPLLPGAPCVDLKPSWPADVEEGVALKWKNYPQN